MAYFLITRGVKMVSKKERVPCELRDWNLRERRREERAEETWCPDTSGENQAGAWY